MTQFLEISRKILRAVRFSYLTAAVGEETPTAQKTTENSLHKPKVLTFPKKNTVTVSEQAPLIRRD